MPEHEPASPSQSHERPKVMFARESLLCDGRASVWERHRWLEELHPSYSRILTEHYDDRCNSLRKQIEDGTVPVEYSLPSLTAFRERVVRLQPFFEAFSAMRWQPEVVFVPQNLPLTTWHKLLTGHNVFYGGLSTGIRVDIDPEFKHVLDDRHGSEMWDVAVICGCNEPAFSDVSPTGLLGCGAKAGFVAESLCEVFECRDGLEKGLLGRRFSPSVDTYWALQLDRLEKQQPPVDDRTWTMVKESINIGLVSLPLRLGWSHWDRAVYGGEWRMGWDSLGGGFRPTVTGVDVLQSPARTGGGSLGELAVRRSVE